MAGFGFGMARKAADVCPTCGQPMDSDTVPEEQRSPDKHLNPPPPGRYRDRPHKVDDAPPYDNGSPGGVATRRPSTRPNPFKKRNAP